MNEQLVAACQDLVAKVNAFTGAKTASDAADAAAAVADAATTQAHTDLLASRDALVALLPTVS